MKLELAYLLTEEETSPELAANKIKSIFITYKGSKTNIPGICKGLQMEYKRYNGFRDSNGNIISAKDWKNRFNLALQNDISKEDKTALLNLLYGKLNGEGGCLNWLN